MTMTFAPGVNPSFPLYWDEDWPVDLFDPIKPYVQVIPRSLRPVRKISPRWVGLTREQKEYFQSFFHELGGPAGIFLWVPMDPVFSPLHRGPDLDQILQDGAPGSPRDYSVLYTWYDDAMGQETRPSPAATITVDAGKSLRAKAPIIPMGVPAIRIYVGSPGAEQLQAFSPSRTWTEPPSGAITGSPGPPDENTLRPALPWRLTTKLPAPKATANRYEIQLEFTEQHV